ncbi:hypothetical protein IW261DRAFT_1424004 [Armillaria novae-zelandiae]|uniref:Uncharacterized protein n=1 Tax=Armillaria novae-zelandiae TaxID=153914 RepID=A0AA39NVY3_9AGAR|nr:hypothetical protein IW261DRAFT_1424004 [Armillaria novae-zelandiae]
MAKLGTDIAEVAVKYSMEWLKVASKLVMLILLYQCNLALSYTCRCSNAGQVIILCQWEICWDNRKSTGIVKVVFHKLEYSIIEVVSTINSEWIKKSKSAYNEFGRHGHAYKVKITPIPNDPDSLSEEYSEIEDEDESSEKAEEKVKEDEDHTEGGDAEVVRSSFLSSAVPMAETSQPCSVTSFKRTKVVPFVDLRSKGSSLPKPTMEVPQPRPQMITQCHSVPPLAPSDTSSEVEG